MNHEKAWAELMELIGTMKEYQLGDDAESMIVSIEHIESQIEEPVSV